MKKAILTISIIFTMCFGASAQTDGFFGWNDLSSDRLSSGSAPAMPTSPIGSTNNDPAVPVGNGLLIMTAFGAAYAIRKRNKDK